MTCLAPRASRTRPSKASSASRASATWQLKRRPSSGWRPAPRKATDRLRISPYVLLRYKQRPCGGL